MKLYKAKDVLRINILQLENKIDDCYTFKELEALTDELIGYVKEVAIKGHERSQKNMKKQKYIGKE